MVDVVVTAVDFSDGLTKENLLDLFDYDTKFTMEFGDEALLPVAKKAGFSTNVDYVLSKSETVLEAVKIFIDLSEIWDNYDLVKEGNLMILGLASE